MNLYTTADGQGHCFLSFCGPMPVGVDGQRLTGIGRASCPKERPDFIAESVSIRTRRTMKVAYVNRFSTLDWPRARKII